MNIFARAYNGLNLSPGERAFLKLAKGWLYTAGGTGLIALVQYLNSSQVDWRHLLIGTGSAAGLSLLNAVDKYFTAQGDAPLATATQAVETKIGQTIQAPPIVQHFYNTPAPATVTVQPVQQPAVQPAPPPVDMQTTQAELEALRKVQ